MKIDYNQFRDSLNNVGKSYFTLNDLMKFYHGSLASLKVLLSNWQKQGLIHGLANGYYALNLTNVDFLHLANDIDTESYISLEYALHLYGLIDQVPSTITCVSKKRSKTIVGRNWIFEYVKFKENLFFGYTLKDKIYIATPEKALADLLYLLSRGKRLIDLDTLNLEKINEKKLHNILKKYPPYTQRKALMCDILKN